MSELKGKLTYVAKTGGIKLDGKDTWYNPTDEFKAKLLENLDKVKGWMNQTVVLNLDDSGKMISMAASVIKKQTPQEPQETYLPEEEEYPMEETEMDEPVEKPKAMEGANKDSTYMKLRALKAPLEKKGKFNYVSWADAWDMLKQMHPDANFKVYESKDEVPVFYTANGGMCKVGVTINAQEHIVWLPIMGPTNQSLKAEFITTFDVNKTIQRAFAKAIAMHGLGIYVFRGEDLPEV